MSLTIWCNSKFNATATKMLEEGVAGHRFLVSQAATASVLSLNDADPELFKADVALGQPNVQQCIEAKKLRWLEVTTAGYTRYDRTDFKEAMRARGSAFTNVSSVFNDPCAQHALAMILSLNRVLPASYKDQLTDRSWQYTERRYHSRLLTGQTVLMLGFGAIGRRRAELLKPFGVTIYAVRRQTRSESGVRIVPEEDLTRVLPLADHVVNILPDNESTQRYVNARRLSWFKRGARFYNIGRGTTVDQEALVKALESGQLGAAYLDVTDPEPLPPSHALWTAPNCYITPHTAGGRLDQDEALVQHFLKNLAAFEKGEPLVDKIL